MGNGYIAAHFYPPQTPTIPLWPVFPIIENLSFVYHSSVLNLGDEARISGDGVLNSINADPNYGNGVQNYDNGI